MGERGRAREEGKECNGKMSMGGGGVKKGTGSNRYRALARPEHEGSERKETKKEEMGKMGSEREKGRTSSAKRP